MSSVLNYSVTTMASSPANLVIRLNNQRGALPQGSGRLALAALMTPSLFTMLRASLEPPFYLSGQALSHALDASQALRTF